MAISPCFRFLLPQSGAWSRLRRDFARLLHSPGFFTRTSKYLHTTLFIYRKPIHLRLLRSAYASHGSTQVPMFQISSNVDLVQSLQRPIRNSPTSPRNSSCCRCADCICPFNHVRFVPRPVNKAGRTRLELLMQLWMTVAESVERERWAGAMELMSEGWYIPLCITIHHPPIKTPFFAIFASISI
jgi:hypothetical protein